jgi:DNA segregation ATPase FtsK/SpoIIIE-like protein
MHCADANEPTKAAKEENVAGRVPTIYRIVAPGTAQPVQTLDTAVVHTPAMGTSGDKNGGAGESLMPEDEELIQSAINVIIRDRRATTGYIQRRLGISGDMAAAIMAVLEQRGMVGPQIGSAPRAIRI